MQLDIIGVPIDLGADRRGVDMGPSAIRYAHLHNKLDSLGYIYEDKGNIEVPIQETCEITDPKLKIYRLHHPNGTAYCGRSGNIHSSRPPSACFGRRSQSLGWFDPRCGKA